MADHETGTVAEKENVQVVHMKDGRKVEFVGKRNMLKESIFENGRWTGTRFDFRHGESYYFPAPAEDAEYTDGEEHYNARDLLAAHGTEQKLGDAAAGKKTSYDMADEVAGVGDRLKEGDWRKAREGGGGFAGTSVLAEAIMRAFGRTAEQAKAFLKEKNPQQKLAMRRDPRLKDVIREIEDERAAKESSSVDTEQLFSELEAA